MANDLFVHHFGSRTFVGNGIDSERVFAENEKRYLAKWGETALHGRQSGVAALRGAGRRRSFGQKRGQSTGRRGRSQSPTGGCLADGCARWFPRSRSRVSLTMIVRDEEKNLSCCLASVPAVR